MRFSNASDFVKSANEGLAPVNGMYILYTANKNTEVPAETAAIISGGQLSDVRSAVNTSATTLGLCRIPIAVKEATSGGYFVSGGSYKYYATTGNYQNVCGLPFSAGVYAQAVMLVNLDRGSTRENGYMYDTGLNYDKLTTPVIAPANGAITIIEKVTL